MTTDNIVMWVTRPQHCRLGLFQDSDFAGDFQDSKSTSGESYVSLEIEHLFLSVGCARSRRQYPTAPQNQESFRWMLDCEWMEPKYQRNPQQETVRAITNPIPNEREPEMLINCRMWTTLPQTQYSQGVSQLYIFEDTEAVIKMIVKGRSPTTRHVSRTHRVALDWLFDRINLDPKIQIKYCHTKNPTRGHVD